MLIKYFGKDKVNYFLLAYIAVGSTTGIKALITSFIPSLNSLDEKKVIDKINTLSSTIQQKYEESRKFFQEKLI